MVSAPLKVMTRTSDIKLGHFVIEFTTPGMGHLLKTADCDFVFFDMEHSGFSFETLKNAIRNYEAAGVPMIVRVPSQDYDQLARACDLGAEGLIVPMVNNAEEAKAIVSHIKYHPDGKRGVALGISHDNYTTTTMPVAERLAASNERTTLFCLIETEEGAENADAIAAVDGVDCIWIGHFDLSASLGVPGEFEHPKYVAAVERIEAAAKKYNRSLGRLVPTTDEGIALYKRGYDFCCYSGDVWVFQQALAEGIRRLRTGCY